MRSNKNLAIWMLNLHLAGFKLGFHLAANLFGSPPPHLLHIQFPLQPWPLPVFMSLVLSLGEGCFWLDP